MKYQYKLILGIIMIVTLFNNLKIYAQSQTITNPILAGFYPDPSITQAGEDYYLVTSTFAYFPGLSIFHSKDLNNWKQVGNAIDRPSQMNFIGAKMTRGLFAPDITYHNGTFYIVCTEIDRRGNFVITSSKPEGPWSDPVFIPSAKGIDPALFFDDNDKAYLIFCGDAPNNKPLYSGHRTLRMYEFDYINLKVIGEEKILINGGADISKKPFWLEGPHIMKKNNWYYLYAAEGGTGINHSEVVFRSKSIEGPYESYENNPILTQRDLSINRSNPISTAGHAKLIDGPDGNTYAIFLGTRPYEGDYYNTGRDTFIAPVKWEKEWPIINEHGQALKYHYSVPIKEHPINNDLPQSGNFSYTLSFNKSIHPSLLWMRTVDSTAFSISKTRGLILKLKPETCMELGNPSFLGKRQQHINSSVDISLEFSPQKMNEKAGLIIFQNENHFYFLSKSLGYIQLYKSSTSSMDLLAQVPISNHLKKIYLRIMSNENSYNFYFSKNAKTWEIIKENVDAKFLSTLVAGGYIGCVYGLYATSNGEYSSNTASFNYLRYKGSDSVYKK